MSLHRYAYGNLNPVDNVDPTGFLSFTEAFSVVSFATVIRMIAIVGVSAVACAVSHNLSAAGVPVFDEGILPCTTRRQFEGITVYRGLNATNPGAFRFDADGLSTFEEKSPGFKWHFPFTIVYRKPKEPGVVAAVVAPAPPSGGTATYTPPPTGHWSINYPGKDIDAVKKELSTIAKTMFK